MKPLKLVHIMRGVARVLDSDMTVSEFAREAHVSPQAVHLAMREGRIRDFKRVGFVYLISRDELKRFPPPVKVALKSVQASIKSEKSERDTLHE